MSTELDLRVVQERLEAEGFVEQLVAEGGMLHALGSNRLFDPAEVAVAETRRFEGASDPDDEAILFAVATASGQPVGIYTAPYGPVASSDDITVIERLHEPADSELEIQFHGGHDHVAAVFANREAAEGAVDELRSLGLGSTRLGIAVHSGDRVAFEKDAQIEWERDTRIAAGTGVAVGFLAGFGLMGVVVAGVGTIGVGGLFALGAASGFVGSVIGGYFGVAAGDRHLEAHERLAQALEPGEVLVAMCSHGQSEVVRRILQRHGGVLREPVSR